MDACIFILKEDKGIFLDDEDELPDNKISDLSIIYSIEEIELINKLIKKYKIDKLNPNELNPNELNPNELNLLMMYLY